MDDSPTVTLQVSAEEELLAQLKAEISESKERHENENLGCFQVKLLSTRIAHATNETADSGDVEEAVGALSRRYWHACTA